MTTIHRSNLPIPQRPNVGLVTYDAQDPDTALGPIEPLRPPEGAPNVVVICSGASSRFTGKVNWVELQIGDDSHDHLITAEELVRVATSIQ